MDVAEVCSSIEGVFDLFSSSLSFLFDISFGSSVDGRFCAAAVVGLTIFGVDLVRGAAVATFFFSIIFGTVIFFLFAVGSSMVFETLSFFVGSLVVLTTDFFVG